MAFSDVPPGEERDERRVRVEGDGGTPEWKGLPGVATYVEPAFFAVLGVRPVAGRLLGPGDVPSDPTVEPASVIVNMKFLERREMEPGASIGRRVRFTTGRVDRPGSWMEIVGVVPDIEANADRVFFDGTPVLYVAAAPGMLEPMSLLIDLGSDPGGFTPRLRTILAETEPAAILRSARPLDEIGDGEAIIRRAIPSVLIGLSMVAIILSTAALYALMSFTVTQRTREIGIRVALGGNAGRIVGTVARRAIGQLALGAALGAGFWAVLLVATVGIGGADSADELAKSLRDGRSCSSPRRGWWSPSAWWLASLRSGGPSDPAGGGPAGGRVMMVGSPPLDPVQHIPEPVDHDPGPGRGGKRFPPITAASSGFRTLMATWRSCFRSSAR